MTDLCGTEATLTADQVEVLTKEDGDLNIPDTFSCSLEAGHLGKHVDIGQTTDENDPLWVTWYGSTGVEVVRLPPCESGIGEEPDDPRDEEYCLLPDGHEGQHTSGSEWWDDPSGQG
jgi:hypothetical protein